MKRTSTWTHIEWSYGYNILFNICDMGLFKKRDCLNYKQLSGHNEHQYFQALMNSLFYVELDRSTIHCYNVVLGISV